MPGILLLYRAEAVALRKTLFSLLLGEGGLPQAGRMGVSQRQAKDCFLARLARGCSFLLVQKRTKDVVATCFTCSLPAFAERHRLLRGVSSSQKARFVGAFRESLSPACTGLPRDARRVPWERGAATEQTFFRRTGEICAAQFAATMTRGFIGMKTMPVCC